jgi:hypothetical protein
MIAIAAMACAVLMAAWGHTETGPAADPDCPACQLAASLVSVAGTGLIVAAPALERASTVAPAEETPPLEPYAARTFSRGPPPSALDA